MSLKSYFGDWLKVFDIKEFREILNKVDQEYQSKLISPDQHNVFKAFNLCPLHDLKVIFLGYDPYPQKGVATGILFGNKQETKEEEISPSLKVIKESVINFEVPHNSVIFDPTLESWAKQGILMINSALTVEVNKTGSHTMLWRPFISSLIRNLSEYNTALVYVLFGKQAQTFKPYIGKFNYVFEIEHPSYFARTHTKMPSKLFRDINKVLNELYGISIEWYKEI